MCEEESKFFDGFSMEEHKTRQHVQDMLSVSRKKLEKMFA
jgi:hypothetical protein